MTQFLEGPNLNKEVGGGGGSNYDYLTHSTGLMTQIFDSESDLKFLATYLQTKL